MLRLLYVILVQSLPVAEAKLREHLSAYSLEFPEEEFREPKKDDEDMLGTGIWAIWVYFFNVTKWILV